MLDFLRPSAASFALALAQFAIGCALALPVYRLLASGRLGEAIRGLSGPSAFAAILAAAACGAVLPLGSAGAVPLAVAASAAGLGAELVIPFLFSNLLFNSLVPFVDPTFIWRTGWSRVLLALAEGCLGGLLSPRPARAEGGLFRFRSLSLKGRSSAHAVGVFGAALACLALGALVDTAYRRYAQGAMVGFLFTSPATSFLPAFFAARNVVNPLFLLAMRILAAVTDFTALAALALVLRPRGILRYFAFFAASAAILSVSAFF